MNLVTTTDRHIEAQTGTSVIMARNDHINIQAQILVNKTDIQLEADRKSRSVEPSLILGCTWAVLPDLTEVIVTPHVVVVLWCVETLGVLCWDHLVLRVLLIRLSMFIMTTPVCCPWGWSQSMHDIRFIHYRQMHSSAFGIKRYVWEKWNNMVVQRQVSSQWALGWYQYANICAGVRRSKMWGVSMDLHLDLTVLYKSINTSYEYRWGRLGLCACVCMGVSVCACMCDCTHKNTTTSLSSVLSEPVHENVGTPRLGFQEIRVSLYRLSLGHTMNLNVPLNGTL